jgi:hypothetical protein
MSEAGFRRGGSQVGKLELTETNEIQQPPRQAKKSERKTAEMITD